MTAYSVRYNASNQKEIVIRSLFFMAILYIFSKLWAATTFSDQLLHSKMLWYLQFTEIIILSIPAIQVDIENDIRSGDIVYHLLKPVTYLWLKIADAVGAFLFRFLILSIVGAPFCFYLSNYLPPLHTLFITSFLAALAGLVFILFHITIGLTAIRLEDSSPVYWIWQRSSFLFGGMLLPLSYYPWYLQYISYVLPFAALLYAPARLMLYFCLEDCLIALIGIVFWGCIAYLCATWLFRRLLYSLKVNGG